MKQIAVQIDDEQKANLFIELLTSIVEVQIGPHKIPGINAAGASTSNEAIIGRDVLNQLIVTLDGISGLAEIS